MSELNFAAIEGRGVHVDQYLTQIALNYKPKGFIAEEIFPVVPVAKKSDSFIQWNQGDLFRHWETKRAPGTRAPLMRVEASSAQYFCQNYALRNPVTDEDRAGADAIFIRHLEEGRPMQLLDAIRIDSEVRIANKLRTAANVGASVVVASAWSDHTVADPLTDMWTVIENIRLATGYRPNRAVFSQVAWNEFSRNDAVISKVNATGVSGGDLPATREQAERLLELERVLVGAAAYNTANEAKPMSLTDVWGDDVLVYYAPARPSIQEPSAGYTFRWRSPELLAGGDMAVFRHPYDSREGAQDIEVRLYQTEDIVAPPLINSIKGINSSQ